MRSASTYSEAAAAEAFGALGPRPAGRPIDLPHLAEQALGDPSLEVEILIMFDEILTVNFARLETAGTLADLQTHLHTLRAASIGVGAWSLAEHVRVMQVELAAGGPVNPERVEDIRMAIEEVRAFIATRVPMDEVRTA